MKKFITLAAIIAAITVSANAQLLLGWDLEGESSPGTSLADNIAAGLQTGGTLNTLSRTGLGVNSGFNSFNSNTWNLTDTFDQTNKYISFTLAPTSGNQVTLTSLEYAINGSNTGPRNGRWGFSLDGGSTFTFQPDFFVTNPAPTSLAIWDFADVTTANAVEFRFWTFGTVSINGGTSTAAGTTRIANISGNDLILNGSVAAIPEPQAIALLVGSLAAIAIFRRKRMA